MVGVDLVLEEIGIGENIQDRIEVGREVGISP